MRSHPSPHPPEDHSTNNTNRDSAVPLAIWLCPADRDGSGRSEGVPRRLIARLVRELARDGHTIVLDGLERGSLGLGPAGYHDHPRPHVTAITLGDLSSVVDGRSAPVGEEVRARADVLLAALPPASGAGSAVTGGLEERSLSWARVVRPGGVLAVITANPVAPFANRVGQVAAAADVAGLAYLQHIVAVTGPVEGDRLLVPDGDRAHRPGGRTRGTGAVHEAHLDVLIFTTTDQPVDGGISA